MNVQTNSEFAHISTDGFSSDTSEISDITESDIPVFFCRIIRAKYRY